MNENPQSNYAWEDRLTWFKSSSEYRASDTIDSEPMEFEWKILQDSPHCSLSVKSKSSCQNWAYNQKISLDGLSSSRCSTTSHGEQECELSAQLVSIFARRFSPGKWSFFGPGSEKKWYSTHEYKPQGEWDRIAEQMMINFADSGHPVFRATSPLSQGTLKSKNGGKLSIHFCAEEETIETVLRTIISVNQLSIYGAVSDLCEEYSTCQTSTGRPVWQDNPTHCLCQVWRRCTHLWPMILRKKKVYCKDTKNELEGYHNKIVWLNFVLMQDSWQQLTSDSISWQKTLKNSHNFQNQWPVVSTPCQETKIFLNKWLDQREHQNWARIGSHNQLPTR